jgi:hypothetical protein
VGEGNFPEGGGKRSATPVPGLFLALRSFQWVSAMNPTDSKSGNRTMGKSSKPFQESRYEPEGFI